MTRQALIESLAESLARVERTPFGTATFDWKRHLSGSERKHFRTLAIAALLEIERLGKFRFERGVFRLGDINYAGP